MNTAPEAALARLVESELPGETPPICDAFADEIRARYGDAVVAVIFYGSCLRRATSEGVLDFYAVVDDYRRAYGSRPPAWLNAALPPNVFFLGCKGHHAKVAVVSTRDFTRGAALRAIRPALWARFSQPFAVPYLRDEAARAAVVAAAATAIETAVTRGLGLLPNLDGMAHVTSQELWSALYRETYASELRTESDASVSALVQRDPQRYERALQAGLESLAREGHLSFERSGDTFTVRDAHRLLGRPRRLRRRAAKALGVVQLLKSAFTVGDWMPYALWKLERHTGTRLEPTDRQLRHPFLFAWPLIFRVLAKKELR